MNRSSFNRPGGRMQRYARRGNSIILVVGLIVLLLIIAISYITRAQGIRSTAAAYRDARVYDGSSDAIAEDIANEIASSLFVKPIDPQDELGQPLLDTVDESRRLQPSEDATRYGVDPNFTWNYAPWSVTPWTNPPDWLTYPNQVGLQHELHYASEVDGSPNAGNWNEPLMGLTANNRVILPPRQNPRGGPGSGDTRWLRDLEPQRQSTDRGRNVDTGFPDAQYADSFSHWRHLTNLSRPDNEWRIVRDIADVTGMRSGAAAWDPDINVATRENWSWGSPWATSPLDGYHYHGGLVERLDVPVEQWPAQSPTSNNLRMTGIENQGTSSPADSGQARFTNSDDFWNRWMAWFDPRGYRSIMDEVHGQPGGGSFASGYEWPIGESLPPNFYDLTDLDGDGIDGEYYDPGQSDTKLGEKPEDEFRKGTARWHVGRVLTDTDGDGFTDSFWYLSPHMAPGGLKQVVGVSVTDNAGRINANVATRFIRNDTVGTGFTQEATRGWTPADMALIGQGAPAFEEPWGDDSASQEAYLEPKVAQSDGNLDYWSVGFFDNRANWSGLFDKDFLPASVTNWYGNRDWLLYRDQDWEEYTSTPNNGNDGAEANQVVVGFDPESFAGSGNLQDLTSELGIDYNVTFPDGAYGEVHDRNNRLHYFQQAGVDPFNPSGFFTPMGIGEELELRSYEGNNLPWLYGRFEQVMNPEWSISPYDNGIEASFLRSGQDREESAALGEQLNNRQLVADNRRKLTFFNSTRNETMPPWLWPENRVGRVSLVDTLSRSRLYEAQPDPGLQDVDGDGVADDGYPRFVPHAREILSQLPPSFYDESSDFTPQGDLNFVDGQFYSQITQDTWEDYHQQMREKIDLREWERPLPRATMSLGGNPTPTQLSYQPLTFSHRLPMAIFTALTSGDMLDSWASRYNRAIALFNNGSPAFQDAQSVLEYANENPRESHEGGGVIPGTFTSYAYSGDSNIEEARQSAAMLAANIQAWRDPDVEAPLYSMGWKNAQGSPRGSFGAVPLPRMDGWELNVDSSDPEYNDQIIDSNTGLPARWRPAIDDQFIDSSADDVRVDDTLFYDNAYQPLEINNAVGVCLNTEIGNESCQTDFTLQACVDQGGEYAWYPELDCAVNGACCVDGLCEIRTISSCLALGGKWYPANSCDDIRCAAIPPAGFFSANLDSPYRGDDFDGPNYPLLWEYTTGSSIPMANPYIIPGLAGSDPAAEVVAGIDNSGDGWPDTWSGPANNTRDHVRNVRALGMEPQPFITEAFVTHVTRPVRIPNEGAPGAMRGGFHRDVFTDPDSGGNSTELVDVWDNEHPAWVVAEGNREGYPQLEPDGASGYMPDPRPSDTISVVQIANPYDTPIPLFDRVVTTSGNVYFLPRYKIRLFGQEFPLSPNINPVTEGRVASLRGIIESGDFDALDSGLLWNPATGTYNNSIQVNTQHGLVLPPATHDRPFTLTIISVPAARDDESVTDARRWTFSLEDDSALRGELDMWLDFLDLNGDAESPWLPQTQYEVDGEIYQVGGGDLVWLLRPAIDPEGDGFYDPTQADGGDDALSDNDDLREIWATNRLYYDGYTDSYYDFSGDETLPANQSWLPFYRGEDSGQGGGGCCFGDVCTEVATSADCTSDGGYFLGSGSNCSGNPCDDAFLTSRQINNQTYWSPAQAAVELVRVDRLDYNQDGDYNDFDLQSVVNGYPTVFEYGSEAFNPATGVFNSLFFDNPDGLGLPEQEIVIDRTLQRAENGTWEDPLMETVTGLQWGKFYPSNPGNSGNPFEANEDDAQVDRRYLYPGSLSKERLPQLNEIFTGPWSITQVDADGPQFSPAPNDKIRQSIEMNNGDRYFPIIWDRSSSTDNDTFSGAPISLGRSWLDLSDHQPGQQDEYPGWTQPVTQQYMANKARGARFAQWARYARPWGLDPEWPAQADVVTPPQQQMEYAAPRFVLGQGSVTRSHSPKQFEKSPSAQFNGEALPLISSEFLDRTSPSNWTFDPTGDEPEDGDEQAIFTSHFAEQRIDPRQSEEIAPGITRLNTALQDGRGNRYQIIIRGNDNSTAVKQGFLGLVDDDDPAIAYKSVDYRDARGAGEASAGHYEFFEFDYDFTGFGESGQNDPDGIFDPSLGVFVDPSGDNAPYFPWLSRNTRMPRVLGGNGQYTIVYRNRKPTALGMIAYENNAAYVDSNGNVDPVNRWSFPDKGVYAIEEAPRFDNFNPAAPNDPNAIDFDADGGYRYDENFLAPFAFQMNHKDGNFEQVGEVLNVWTHSHLVSQPYLDGHYPGLPGVAPRPDPSVPVETIRTFSESLSEELQDTITAARPVVSRRVQQEIAGSQTGGIGVPDNWRWTYRDHMRDALRRVGRLEVSPGAPGRNNLVGEPVKDLASDDSSGVPTVIPPWVRPNTELSHLEPIQPAGQRVLDLFVCDGPGIHDLVDNISYNQGQWNGTPDGIIDPEPAYEQYSRAVLNQGIGYDPNFMNARGFEGKGTPGLVNINTATLETLRTLPHMYRMVHAGNDSTNAINANNVLDTSFGGERQNRNPRVAIPEALIQYRDLLGVASAGGQQPSRSAPYVGTGDAWLPFQSEQDLDLDDSGVVEDWEFAMSSGYGRGPNYSVRGSHTPLGNVDATVRSDVANLNIDAASRQNAGYSPEYDVTFADDGIATGSGVRGFRGLGELFQLETPSNSAVEVVDDLVGNWTSRDSWEIDFAANRPFRSLAEYVDAPGDTPLQDNRFEFWDIGANLGTDVSTISDSRGDGFQFLHGKTPKWKRLNELGVNNILQAPNDSRYRERVLGGDMVAGDAEEANMLFSGISNMISTRSDMFTVHFRVRTFKPDPETGVWDATNPDAIVDDSRYVMLVDRSEVDHPGDQPRIVYLEKIEN